MVSVVTVTYGDRVELLSTVLTRILSADLTKWVSEVVVVDNASAAATKSYLRSLAESDERVVVVTLDSNEGSAGGFGAGLVQAAKGDASFVFLLDDDNLLCVQALQTLVETYLELEAREPSVPLALLCTRWDHPYHQRLALGEAVERAFPRRSSYCGFHLFEIASRIVSTLRPRSSKTPESANLQKLVLIPYGPYGGLFFRLELISDVGLPNPDYFVYADDFEYTHRMVSHGIQLFLEPRCRIADIEDSWSNDRRRPSVLRSIYLHPSDERIYLSLRNQVHFEKSLEKSPVVYPLNRLMFMVLLFGAAIRFNEYRRFRLAITALVHGELGRLGRPDWAEL